MYFYDCLNDIKHFLAYNFQEFREKMEYKKTIIMVTHSLDNLKYATRHIKIIDGKVVLDEQLNA